MKNRFYVLLHKFRYENSCSLESDHNFYKDAKSQTILLKALVPLIPFSSVQRVENGFKTRQNCFST